jgi:hypothetical protein
MSSTSRREEIVELWQRAQEAGRKWLLDFLYVQQLRRVGTRGREEVLGSEHKYVLGWSGIPSHSHIVGQPRPIDAFSSSTCDSIVPFLGQSLWNHCR